MFNYEKKMKKLSKLDKYDSDKQKKIIKKIFNDEEFYDFLYGATNGKDHNRHNEEVNNLINVLSRPLHVKLITKELKNNNISVNRSSIVCIYSICTSGLDKNNIRLDVIEEKKEEIDDIKACKNDINKYGKLVTELADEIRSASKEMAKSLSKKSNIDKAICIEAICKLSPRKYITKYNLSKQMNEVLKIIYKNTSETNYYDNENTDWEAFFTSLFGKHLVPNIATFILLEGINRIEKYTESDGIDALKDCWDALSKFALDELDKCDDRTRNQMMEIYIKRATNMNTKVPLRVDLMKVPSQFSKLIGTINKYADKLNDIFDV